MRRISLIAALLTLTATTLSGQDLNRLRNRAQELLVLRSTVDIKKVQAVQYIQTENRQEFLESRPLPMRDAHVTGYEFTDDPKVVYVIFKALVIIPEMGPVPRTGREPWVWDKKDWFLRLEDLGNPFLASKNGPPLPPAKPLPLDLSTTQLDFGKHVQGETINGTIEFKSDKNEFKVFRSSTFPGLYIGGPIWTSDEAGKFEITLDTTLLSEDVHYSVELEFDGYSMQETRKSFELVAQIEPRLRLTQNPPILDPTHAGTTEITIENLSKTPFRLTLIHPVNDLYKFTADVPMTKDIGPGEMLKVGFAYPAQPEPVGAQLIIGLSEPILGKRSFTLPLNVKLPAPEAVEYTREQLDEINRKQRQK
jgi:hypothetical protein